MSASDHCGARGIVATDNEYDEDGYGNRDYFQAVEDLIREERIVGRLFTSIMPDNLTIL